MKMFVKRPGKKPELVVCDNSLKTLQQLVGGYIEAVTISDDLVLICNEEGRITGLPYNCQICGIDFYGPVLFVGVDGEEFADVPLDFQGMKSLFPQLWEV